MDDSEDDVPAEFGVPMSLSVLSFMVKRTDSTLFDNHEIKNDVERELKRFLYFKSMVESGSKYNLKLQNEWSAQEYRYNGMVIRNDGPGNVAYGYFGRAMGIPGTILLGGAGTYQLFQNNTKFKWITSFFDDPCDQEMIKLGIRYYKSRH